MDFDFGWVYTIATMAGSLYISTCGESRKAWFFYLCAAVIGIVYFVLTLLVYFAIMNALAMVRVHLKIEHGITLKQAILKLFQRKKRCMA